MKEFQELTSNLAMTRKVAEAMLRAVELGEAAVSKQQELEGIDSVLEAKRKLVGEVEGEIADMKRKVEAANKKAEDIVAAANTKADEVLMDVNAKARKIIANAEAKEATNKAAVDKYIEDEADKLAAIAKELEDVKGQLAAAKEEFKTFLDKKRAAIAAVEEVGG